MKKFLTFGLIAFLASSIYALESGVYGSLTSIDQLNTVKLKAGQFAYYENDGAIEMFAGAKETYETLRVCDPAALSGYRIREFDSELTVSCTPNMTMEPNKGFKFTIKGKTPDEYIFNETLTTSSVESVQYYTKSGDTYTPVSVPAGTDLSGGGYYTRTAHWYCQLVAYSKDSEIFELTYDETHRSGGLSDFYEISADYKTTYDGLKATVDIDITSTNPNNSDWFIVSNFKATTLAIGDRVHTTDLQKTKILIYDDYSPAPTGEVHTSKRFENSGKRALNQGFDLSKLRTWTQHLYDGNRGENWSRYMSEGDVTINTNRIIKFSSIDASGRVNRYLMGSTGAEFYMIHDDYPWMRFTPANATSSTPSGNECQITAIRNFGMSGENPEIDFSFLNPVPPAKVIVLYRDTLEYGFWKPISATLTYNGAQTEYTAQIPLAYNISDRGFWKIKVLDNASDNRVKINATVSIMADDGNYYKLTFPSGGGAVTAVLDDKQ